MNTQALAAVFCENCCYFRPSDAAYQSDLCLHPHALDEYPAPTRMRWRRISPHDRNK